LILMNTKEKANRGSITLINKREVSLKAIKLGLMKFNKEQGTRASIDLKEEESKVTWR
jgi:hypothetical protein